MTLFECLETFLSANAGLVAALPGGFRPGVIPQDATFPMCLVRYISGVSEPPTHDGGASPISQLRIELTFWGGKYKDMERCAMLADNLFSPFNGYLGGGSNGRFACSATNGPRDVQEPIRRLAGIQLDIIGKINWNTIS